MADDEINVKAEVIEEETPVPAASKVQKSEDVMMKCKKCEGMVARELKIPELGSTRMYQCTTCSHTWQINVGAGVNFL